MSAFARLRDTYAAGAPRPLKILGASGQLGYGIPTEAFERGLARAPDFIGCDMGSIDIGPTYLGEGTMAPARSGAKRDLAKVLKAARALDIPLIIGSAGSAGARAHLDATLALIREIALEHGLRFKLASIAADIPAAVVKQAIDEGRVSPMDTMPALSHAEVDAAAAIVGQMGLEAFRRALDEDVDVLVAGRSCDTAIFATIPHMLGFPLGLATHMAKIIECASICCTPGGRDTILAELDGDGFVLESMALHRAATPASVAAHSLYEQADPFTITEPAGSADLTNVRYDAIDDRRTRVSGATFKAAARPTIKLEGARRLGRRAILLCAAADPRFIARRSETFEEVTRIVRDLVEGDEDYTLFFRVFGVDGVRPLAAPLSEPPREVFIVGECIAPSANRALEVMRTAKQYLLHHGYPGRLSTAGNLAFPFTPPEVSLGAAYRFNIFHRMEVADPAPLFPVSIEHI